MDHRIFVFTVHKAASLGVYEVMRRVAKKEGWPLHSANLKTPNLIEPTTPGDESFYQQLEGKTGMVGPVRFPVAIDSEALAKDRFILHLRDPRDVLVSMFYSWSYSHPGVADETRERWRSLGIDAFALRNSAELKRKYDHYIRDLLPLKSATLLKYEDFVLNRPAWLGRFLNAAGLEGRQSAYGRLARQNPAANVKSENIHAHIRKAAPGDHIEKLQSETKAALNEEWGSALKALDYAI